MVDFADKGMTRRLADSVRDWSDKPRERFRRTRRDMLRAFAGPWFGDEATEIGSRNRVNLMYAVSSIFLPTLVLEPRPLVTSADVQYTDFARRIEGAIGHLASQCDITETLRLCILDALYGVGIMCTTMSEPDTPRMADAAGYLPIPGTATVYRVSEERFIEDMSAEAEDAVSFRGHRFSVPWEWARECGLYDAKGIDALHARTREQRRRAVDLDGRHMPDLFVDEIELASLWLPKHGLVAVLPGDMNDAVSVGAVRVDEYVGPPGGQYTKIGFMPMPDSLFPVPPMTTIFDLSRVVNDLSETLQASAEAQKTVLVAAPGSKSLAIGMAKAKHLAILEGNKDGVGVFNIGAPTKEMYEAIEFFRGLLNYVIGNPALIGGLQKQSNTASQDYMLMQSAQVQVSDKRNRIRRAASDVMAKLGWYLWHDTVGQYDMGLTERGESGPMAYRWNPKHREGGWDDYNIKVRAYAALDDSPQANYERSIDWLTRVLLPLSQAAGPQGLGLDVQKLARDAGRNAGYEDAEASFVPIAPQRMEVSGAGVSVTNNMGGRVTPRAVADGSAPSAPRPAPEPEGAAA